MAEDWFDRSYLPTAKLEVALLADTHHLLDPEMYAAEGDSQMPELMRDWGARAEWALTLAAALNAPYVFHVGDLQQEYPDSQYFDRGREAALAQLENSRLALAIAAGNMDIGDKPDPTMPASWVTPANLKRWEDDFGPSFHAVSHDDLQFLFLNSQIMNSDLPEAIEQQEWVEWELSNAAYARRFIFLHMPPFLVDEDEPGLGSYDAIGEPARGWLLSVCRRYGVEAVFAGHTHFRLYNRVGSTRIHCLPSTTTTRPGFPEAFAVLPEFEGKADNEKLGFCLLRVLDSGHALHVVRTGGEVGPRTDSAWSRVLTCTTAELSTSPLGVFLRLPLSRRSEGVVGYPYQVRHRIRDDHPLLACLELGAHHARFPINDLDEPVQAPRLSLLADDGVALTGTVIWNAAGSRNLEERHLSSLDVLEIQLAGRLEPTQEDVDAFLSIRDRGVGVSLSPIVMEDVGLVHRRGRSWYRPDDVSRVDESLVSFDTYVDRVVVGIDTHTSPWQAIGQLSRVELRAIGSIDFLLDLGDDGVAAVRRVGEALMGCACVPDSRLWIDPLQDSDRTASVKLGLLDRLSNPRPAFYAAKVINTILYGRQGEPGYRPLGVESDGQGGLLSIGDERRLVWAVIDAADSEAAQAISAVGADCEVSSLKVVDPVRGLSSEFPVDRQQLTRAFNSMDSQLKLVVADVESKRLDWKEDGR